MTESAIVYTTETSEEPEWYANVHRHAFSEPIEKWDGTKCECGFDHEHHWIDHEYTECDICQQSMAGLQIEELQKENAALKAEIAQLKGAPMTTEKPAPWHLDVWFEGDQYEAIRTLSERWNCSLEEIVRRAVDGLVVDESIAP